MFSHRKMYGLACKAQCTYAKSNEERNIFNFSVLQDVLHKVTCSMVKLIRMSPLIMNST